MRKTQPPFENSTAVSVRELQALADGWLMDCEYRQHSRRTLEARRAVLDKLLWFLHQQECPDCGTKELRQFLIYLQRDPAKEGARWQGKTHSTKPVKPGTVATYHRILRAFFNWCVEEGAFPVSPMAKLKAPVDRPDQVEPFTTQQVNALLAATRKTAHPKRDYALFSVLLDTGMRASELCSLRCSDMDFKAGRLTVREGKGGKSRVVPLSSAGKKALWDYLRETEREPEEALFQADRGPNVGAALTRNGLYQLIRRIGAEAGIQTARCSPHTFRHTFSVLFLRNGGNQLTLMQILGHVHISMTQRYVKLAQGDIEGQHRQYSPLESILKGRKG